MTEEPTASYSHSKLTSQTYVVLSFVANKKYECKYADMEW